MSNFWDKRRVLVTGGMGFIGSHVVELLVAKGAVVTAICFSSHDNISMMNLQSVKEKITIVEADLTRSKDCMAVCQHQDIVINSAHVDGNVVFKRSRPAFIFRQNMLITLNMLQAACENYVSRFLVMSSAEASSSEKQNPTSRSEGFMGFPDLTDGYAWSKRMSEIASEFFFREYGIRVAIARPSNVYGPRDYFDSKRGRVIPMFIKRIFEEEKSLVIWGTGEQVRTFLFVEDLARGLLDLIEKHPKCDPIDLCGNEEITIRKLAELIVRLSGKKVKIICDAEKPGGALRRTCDIAKAKRITGFLPAVSLESGLKPTIDFFRKYYFS